MRRCILRSRMRKFVAQLSSSKRRISAPSSIACDVRSACFHASVGGRERTSMTPAAMDVLPLASCVENEVVDVPPGRFVMKGAMLTFVTARPSSPWTETQWAEVTRNSRPSGDCLSTSAMSEMTCWRAYHLGHGCSSLVRAHQAVSTFPAVENVRVEKGACADIVRGTRRLLSS